MDFITDYAEPHEKSHLPQTTKKFGDVLKQHEATLRDVLSVGITRPRTSSQRFIEVKDLLA